MDNQFSILLACDNPWLANSARILIRRGDDIRSVEVCKVKDLVMSSTIIHPDVIVIFNGISLYAHERELALIRSVQPRTRIVMSVQEDRERYEQHPLAHTVDAFVEEDQLAYELGPIITRLTRRNEQ